MGDAAKIPDTAEPDTVPEPMPGQLSIPDGGLSASMPDWLQRPPAWQATTTRGTQTRDLPPPDTSVIDPRTMLDIADLPEWLQRIAARASAPEVAATEDRAITAPPEAQVADPAPLVSPASHVEETLASAPARPPEVVLAPRTPANEPEWWRTKNGQIGLAVLALLIAVWVVLVAI